MGEKIHVAKIPSGLYRRGQAINLTLQKELVECETCDGTGLLSDGTCPDCDGRTVMERGEEITIEKVDLD